MAAIPHIKIADHNTRLILQPMKQTIEEHTATINSQAALIKQMQIQIDILKAKSSAS